MKVRSQFTFAVSLVMKPVKVVFLIFYVTTLSQSTLLKLIHFCLAISLFMKPVKVGFFM
jgi:hypothetical protein